MNDQIFSDGVGSIAFVNGTVRIDLVALTIDKNNLNSQPTAVLQQRIVMLPDAFLRSAQEVHEAAEAIARLGAKGKSDTAATESRVTAGQDPSSTLPFP